MAEQELIRRKFLAEKLVPDSANCMMKDFGKEFQLGHKNKAGMVTKENSYTRGRNQCVSASVMS